MPSAAGTVAVDNDVLRLERTSRNAVLPLSVSSINLPPCLLSAPGPLPPRPPPLPFVTGCNFRDESAQKPSVSSGTAKGHTDLDGALFHKNGPKGDGEFLYHRQNA